MNNSLATFQRNIESARTIESIYSYFVGKATPIDVAELLRAEYVMIVSALDYYVHDIVRDGMLCIFDGYSSENKCFRNFKISMEAVMQVIRFPQNAHNIVGLEIRRVTEKNSYQSTTNINNALNLIGIQSIWSKIDNQLKMSCQDISKRLNLIVTRRNKIAHESDFDSTKNSKSPIELSDIIGVREFIVQLVCAIDAVINKNHPDCE